uniref:Uncharacterized protein n=1 Tax=Arundo donax TaxID=35708 RepID=A0A0A9HCS9_ARUDO
MKVSLVDEVPATSVLSSVIKRSSSSRSKASSLGALSPRRQIWSARSERGKPGASWEDSGEKLGVIQRRGWAGEEDWGNAWALAEAGRRLPAVIGEAFV